MTNDEAVLWLKRHSVIAVFHESRTVLVLPYKQLDIEAFKETGFKLEIRKGFAIAYTEPGDELHHVVEAARAAWAAKLSPVDRISEQIGGPTPPVKFDFRSNM